MAVTIAGLAVHSGYARTSIFARWMGHDFGPDCVARQKARFERVRPLIPSRGVLAFVGPNLIGEEGDQCSVGYVAQRTLAPVLLVDRGDGEFFERARSQDFVIPPTQPLALVDMSSREGADWRANNPDYQLVADVGDGIFLLSAK